MYLTRRDSSVQHFGATLLRRVHAHEAETQLHMWEFSAVVQELEISVPLEPALAHELGCHGSPRQAVSDLQPRRDGGMGRRPQVTKHSM